MNSRRSTRLRQQITREAARLMYQEQVKQYLTAKRMAARRLLGRAGGRRLRFRPRDLPTNGEIREALLELARACEGELHEHRLFALRVVALQVMDQLEPFSPRLIGSVSTGHVRRGSDVDIHVFTDDTQRLRQHVTALGWEYDSRVVSIRKGNQFRDYTHLYIEHLFPVEQSVYEPAELRVTSRSSTDGKPIKRVKPAALLALVQAEHPDQWQSYIHTGMIPQLERLQQDEEEAWIGPPLGGVTRGGRGGRILRRCP